MRVRLGLHGGAGSCGDGGADTAGIAVVCSGACCAAKAGAETDDDPDTAAAEAGEGRDEVDGCWGDEVRAGTGVDADWEAMAPGG